VHGHDDHRRRVGRVAGVGTEGARRRRRARHDGRVSRESRRSRSRARIPATSRFQAQDGGATAGVASVFGNNSSSLGAGNVAVTVAGRRRREINVTVDNPTHTAKLGVNMTPTHPTPLYPLDVRRSERRAEFPHRCYQPRQHRQQRARLLRCDLSAIRPASDSSTACPARSPGVPLARLAPVLFLLCGRRRLNA